MLRRLYGLAAAAALAGWSADAAAEPRPATVPVAEVDRAVAGLPAGACRDQIRAELRDGERQDQRCAHDRVAATRALLRRRRVEFGVVAHRRVNLVGIQLVLSSARRCRQWPLRSPTKDVIRFPDVDQARCRLLRYEGPVSLTVVDPRGLRHEVMRVDTDRDGRVHVRFAEVDAALRAHGGPGLDAFAKLELGQGGWAGTVDLVRLRGFSADWHYRWIRRGRGVPALFAQRHPDHEGAADARALAVEAELARQEADYVAVGNRTLRPGDFLARYVLSPYRRSVEAMALGRGAPPTEQPDRPAQAGDGARQQPREEPR